MTDTTRFIATRENRSMLTIALERRARIRAALERARANGFDVARLRVDLARVEREIVAIKGKRP